MNTSNPERMDERRWERIETIGNSYTPRTGHTVVSNGSMIYVFGGTDRRRRQQDLYEYNIESSKWSQVNVSGLLPPRRSGALGIVYDNKFFLFGGYDGRDGNYFNDLFYFDFRLKCWNEMPSQMGERPQARTDHIMCLYQHQIYIFGGYDGHTRYNDMYMYDIERRKWNHIFPTTSSSSDHPSRRFGHAGAIHEKTKKLYIFGGWDGRDTLDDLYVFDLELHTWKNQKTFGKIPPHRYRHTIVIHEDNLYLFGGVDKAHCRFNDLQRLDLNTFRWSEVITTGYVPSSRTFHRAVILNKRMYILGGYDGTDRLHDLYSIHVGSLTPPSLLNISASYIRNNVHDLLEQSISFLGIPQELLEQVIWRRDFDSLLRGKCSLCQHGQCCTYEPSKLMQMKGSSTVYSPCICGHPSTQHQFIYENQLMNPLAYKTISGLWKVEPQEEEDVMDINNNQYISTH